MANNRSCQFEEWKTEGFGFPSTWKNTREEATTSVQTEEIKFQDRGTENASTLSKKVQTDFDETKDLQPVPKIEPYPPSLYAFFAKVTDEVCKCLQENLDPFAFEVFKDCGEEKVKSNMEASKEFTLHSSSVSSSNEFAGSCVSWNKAGTQIAVGYSALSHDSWCSHRVPVSVWNLQRTQNFKAHEPHSEILLPSCITAMEFHPTHPSVVVVGLYSGNVALVDFSSSDTFLRPETNEDDVEHGVKGVKTGDGLGQLGYFMDRAGHLQCVTNVHWIKLTPNQSGQLISKKRNASLNCVLSSGRDGHICLWSTNTSNTRLCLEKKFIAWADNIPAEVPLKNKGRLGMKELGILGLGCCKDDPFAFVFATYGGFIFQGSLDSNIEAYTAMSELASSDTNQEVLYDPGVVFLSTCDGLPNVIDCSPFHRNIFLAATANGTVVIRNLLEPMTPMAEYNVGLGVKSLSPLNDAKWSWRPTMFAVAQDTVVKVYDLQIGQLPAVMIPHTEIIAKIAFNENDLGTLAVCDTKGAVHIWHLPSTLSSHEPHDLDILISLSHNNLKPKTAEAED